MLQMCLTVLSKMEIHRHNLKHLKIKMGLCPQSPNRFSNGATSSEQPRAATLFWSHKEVIVFVSICKYILYFPWGG